MTAHIMKRSNNPVIGADNDDRITIHRQGEIIPGLANLTGVPNEDPSATPNAFEIESIDFLVEIKLAREGPAGATFSEQRSDAQADGVGRVQRTSPGGNARIVFTAWTNSVLHDVGILS